MHVQYLDYSIVAFQFSAFLRRILPFSQLVMHRFDSSAKIEVNLSNLSINIASYFISNLPNIITIINKNSCSFPPKLWNWDELRIEINANFILSCHLFLLHWMCCATSSLLEIYSNFNILKLFPIKDKIIWMLITSYFIIIGNNLDDLKRFIPENLTVVRG